MIDFEDSSAGHTEVHTPTIYTGASISSAVYKYGDGSGYFTGGKVTYPDSADWNFGAAPFTVSAWIKTPVGGTGHWFSHDTDANNQIIINLAGLYPRILVYSGGVLVVHIRATISCDAEWHHIEISRDASSGYLFVDGVKQTLTYNTYNGTIPDLTGVLNIGWYKIYPVDELYSSGYIDNIKFDKGICRHTTNFTPPANENIDNDSYTVLLLKMNSSPFKLQIGDTWKNATPYINIADSWKTVLNVYISLHGNATWESVKDMTWQDLINETWDYEKQSWRTVI